MCPKLPRSSRVSIFDRSRISRTEQIEPDRESDSGTALKILSIFKMKQPVQTTVLYYMKTEKKENHLSTYSPMVKEKSKNKNNLQNPSTFGASEALLAEYEAVWRM